MRSSKYKEELKESVDDAVDRMTRYSGSMMDSLQDIYFEILRRINEQMK